MTMLEANCPACGATVTFKSGSSVVVVCEYCNSVLARSDRALEDLGKVAEVVESGSPLERGMRGVYRGVPFELTGRAQLRHAAGGMWDEWYAAFSDGRWGWLAEAGGRFYLTYQAPRTVAAPPFEQLELGRTVAGIPVAVPLVVAEKGEARAFAAEGEIPYRLTPGEEYLYADLSGQGGIFATIDYSEEPPLVFVGRETTLTELGIVSAAATRQRQPRRTTAAQLQCPQCAGPLELRAPDQSERVTCPNCGSLLDVNEGRLRFLKALEPGKFKPAIPLGSTVSLENLLAAAAADDQSKDETKTRRKLKGDGAAALNRSAVGTSTVATSAADASAVSAVASGDGATQLTVIGFMTRSVEFEGVRYFWDEYLLYHPRVGFRWLVQSDNHWSLVEAVPPGEITEEAKAVRLRGDRFKIFQDAVARVEYVAGEFYWKVTTGERVRAVDYVRPPLILSKEVSGDAARRGNQRLEAEEVNWSLGRYVPYQRVERLFGVELPRPITVAPNQPFGHKGIYKRWLLFCLMTIILGFVFSMMDSHEKVFEQTYQFQPPAQTTPTPIQLPGGRTVTVPSFNIPNVNGYDGTQVVFTEPIQLRARQNIEITGAANVDNNWLYVEGDLINEQTGLVQQFELPIEYYYGVEGGESWSEGGRDKTVHLSALPAGSYTMRLEAQWEKWKQADPPRLTVKVVQGTATFINPLLALLALSLVPIIVLLKRYSFEKRRWADSAFNPYDTGDDDSSDD